jgi:hypothetical protein
VRGGAIPVLAWGTLLLALYLGNWIWDGTHLNPAVTAFAVLLIYVIGVILILERGAAIRRRPPPSEPGPQAEPDASLAAVVAGLAVACILFGVAWSTFLVFFGAAMLLLALGRLGVELRVQRITVARARARARGDEDAT